MSGPDLVAFMAEHGRPPMIDDEIKPWRYRGWLLYYVQELHRVHPQIPDRWGYLFETHALGRWPDHPIPELIIDRPDPEVIKQIERATDMIAATGKGWGSFSRLVEWLAWGLASSARDVAKEPDLDDRLNEQLYRFVNLGPWLISPYDYLGRVACERFGGGPNAFFPTPHEVIKAMVEMQFVDQPKGADLRAYSVCDPALGTGRMLLHASNYCMFLYGQDIDPLVLEIARINGALYAPWMVCPPPDHLRHKRKLLPPPPVIEKKKRLPPPPGV